LVGPVITARSSTKASTFRKSSPPMKGVPMKRRKASWLSGCRPGSWNFRLVNGFSAMSKM
jgi:hypothetical protein